MNNEWESHLIQMVEEILATVKRIEVAQGSMGRTASPSEPTGNVAPDSNKQYPYQHYCATCGADIWVYWSKKGKEWASNTKGWEGTPNFHQCKDWK